MNCDAEAAKQMGERKCPPPIDPLNHACFFRHAKSSFPEPAAIIRAMLNGSNYGNCGTGAVSSGSFPCKFSGPPQGTVFVCEHADHGPFQGPAKLQEIQYPRLP